MAIGAEVYIGGRGFYMQKIKLLVFWLRCLLGKVSTLLRWVVCDLINARLRGWEGLCSFEYKDRARIALCRRSAHEKLSVQMFQKPISLGIRILIPWQLRAHKKFDSNWALLFLLIRSHLTTLAVDTQETTGTVEKKRSVARGNCTHKSEFLEALFYTLYRTTCRL